MTSTDVRPDYDPLDYDPLDYDPIKPGDIVYTDYDQAYEPIRHVIHHTIEGRLVWFCTNCARISPEPGDGFEWTCCGTDDGDAVVSDPITCSGDVATCLLAGTDECQCPDGRTLVLVDALAALGVRAAPMGSDGESYGVQLDPVHLADSDVSQAYVTWQDGVGWTIAEIVDPGGSSSYLDVPCDAGPSEVAGTVKAYFDGEDSRVLGPVPPRIDGECGRCSLAGGSSPIRHQIAGATR